MFNRMLKFMKKIRFVTLLAASQFVLMGYAQTPQFDLSEYKLPDLKRHALVTWFDLSGQNSSFKTPSSLGSPARKSTGNTYNTNLLTHYSFYQNSLTKQMEVDGIVRLNYNYGNSKEDKKLSQERYNIWPEFDFKVVNRNYFNSKKFVETDFISSYTYSRSYSSDNSSSYASKSDFKDHRFIAYVPIKVGIGRIEEVQDERHALYIFDELAKQGRVSSTMNNEDVLAFARLISKLKNKRFFDSRIRKIYEIETIDSFLVANDYVTESDARYFTTLNDFWLYGGEPVRKSGTRFSGGIYPGYYFYDYDRLYKYGYEDEKSDRIDAFLLNAGFELNYEKPINRYFQNSIALEGFGGTVVGKVKSSNDKVSVPNLQLGYKQTIGFYPNTRTDVTFSYGAKFVQLFGNSDETSDKISPEALGARFMSNLGVNYYVSPRVMLSVKASLDYIYQDSKEYEVINFNKRDGNSLLVDLLTNNSNSYFYLTNQFASYFQVSLSYSIF